MTSFKDFLKYNNERIENNEQRERLIEADDVPALLRLPSISFDVCLYYSNKMSIDIGGSATRTLISLDEEDIDYFVKKATRLLEAEKQQRIDAINKEYEQLQ